MLETEVTEIRNVRGNNDSAQETTDLVGLLIVLAKRKSFILWPTVVITVLAAVYCLTLPNQYTAETRILAPQTRDSMSALLLGQFATLGALGNVKGLSASALGLNDPNAMYVSMLQSRTLADRIIDRFGLMAMYQTRSREETRVALAHATDVTSAKDGGITVRVTDLDRNRAAEIANAYVEEFRKITDQLALTEAAQRRLYFENELNKIKEHLATAESSLRVSQEETGMLELDSQSKSIIQATVALKAQIAAKEVQVQSMSSFATPQNPDLILAQGQLAAMRTQLSRLENGSAVGHGDVLVPTRQIPKTSLQYAERLRDVKYYEQIFKVLATQYEAAKADEGRSAVIVQVLDQAVPPERKSKPHRAFIVLFVAVLSFSTFVLAAFGMESLEQIQNDPKRSGQLHLLKFFLLPRRRRAQVLERVAK